ncbi:MAG: HIT domain-containing protein [Candidatus Norongarragalinales archaeon]
MDCVFCTIVEGKAHSAKLGENKHAMAILDAFPIVEGHTLVIPKAHHKALWDFNKDELHSIFDLVVAIEKMLLKNLPCDGVDLRQHYRPFVPETKLSKQHVHFHLLPRKSWDNLFKHVGVRETELRKEPSQKDLDSLAEKIRGKQKTL